MVGKRKGPQADSLAANPKASQTLTNLVATGQIKASDGMKEWYNNPKYATLFAPIHIEKFRKRYKKLLSDKYGSPAMQMALRLSSSTTAGEGISTDDVRDCDDDEEVDITEQKNIEMPGAEFLMSPLQFKPLYMLGSWKDPRTKDDKISIAVLLPSGISEHPGDIVATVVDDWFMQLSVTWPTSFMSTVQLMHIWLQGDGVEKIEDYHPHFQSFSAFRERFQTSEEDKIHSVARIPLPFAVKSDFEQHLLGWHGTSQTVLFLILSAPSRNFTTPTKKLVMKKSLAPSQPSTSSCTTDI
eukprot:IDg3541t1